MFTKSLALKHFQLNFCLLLNKHSPLNSILASFSPLHLGIWNCLSLIAIDIVSTLVPFSCCPDRCNGRRKTCWCCVNFPALPSGAVRDFGAQDQALYGSGCFRILLKNFGNFHPPENQPQRFLMEFLGAVWRNSISFLKWHDAREAFIQNSYIWNNSLRLRFFEALGLLSDPFCVSGKLEIFLVKFQFPNKPLVSTKISFIWLKRIISFCGILFKFCPVYPFNLFRVILNTFHDNASTWNYSSWQKPHIRDSLQ